MVNGSPRCEVLTCVPATAIVPAQVLMAPRIGAPLALPLLLSAARTTNGTPATQLPPWTFRSWLRVFLTNRGRAASADGSVVSYLDPERAKPTSAAQCASWCDSRTKFR